MRLIGEIFGHTKFDDTARLRDILSEIRVNMKDSMENGGHATAMQRILSYSSRVPYENERFSGVEFFRFIDGLLRNFDEEKDALVRKLCETEKEIFKKGNLVISFTGSEEEWTEIREALPAYLETLPSETSREASREIRYEALNEGFKTASLVQYAAMGGNFKEAGIERLPSGLMMLAKQIISTEYLWTNLRVKGGAYGCMMRFDADGRLVFCSYRDPHLKESLDIYRGVPEWLRSLELSERDLRKFILGTFGSADAPLLPPARGREDMMIWLTGSTEERRRENRRQILECTMEDLHDAGRIIEAVLRQNRICVVGSEQKIRENAEIFGSITGFQGE